MMLHPVGGLADFFKPVQPEDTTCPGRFYAMRYFTDHDLLYRKYDPYTSAEKRLLMTTCPGPRMTSFMNGSVFFPYSNRTAVLERVAMDIKSDTPSYWNQIAYDTPEEGCRLAVDIDSTRVIPHDEVASFARVLWSTLQHYFAATDGAPIPIMVSTCGPRLKKGVLSTGIHMVCHVRVSIEQARQILLGFEMRLVADPGIDTSRVEVDSSIYKPGARMVSLRMVYSSKIENCPVCQNMTERRLACSACATRGVAISAFTYKPVFAVDWETGAPCTELFLRTHRTFLEVVRNHSLWPEAAAEQRRDYRLPAGDPPCGGVPSRVRRLPSAANAPADDRAALLVEEAVRRLQHPPSADYPWPSVTISRVRVLSPRRAHVYVDGIGSTRCLYAEKDHGSNRVWFVLHRNGDLVLYCHSKKAENSCQSKPRIRFRVPQSIVQHVFGIPVITDPVTTIDAPDLRMFNRKRPRHHPDTPSRRVVHAPDA
jgi:hypothetical protein